MSVQKQSCSFLIGFDGFIDEILTCVQTRYSQDIFDPYSTIQAFGEKVLEASRKSINFELVTKQRKLGGNGPILAEALILQGNSPTLIGALGSPEIDPLFQPLAARCKKVFSICPPGHTDALEFSDGKIILGKHESILTINKKLLLSHISKNELISLFENADIFVSVNWTMIPEMTELWEYLIEDILPELTMRPRSLFIDLADPAKRSDSDLKKALYTLKRLQKFYDVTLGLNEREAERIAKLFDIDIICSKESAVPLLKDLLSKTQLNCIVIHGTKYAAAQNNNEEALVDGPFCENPLITTGGGDNFNAGFLIGQSQKQSLKASLLRGVQTSGFYVRTGKSPSLQELFPNK